MLQSEATGRFRPVVRLSAAAAVLLALIGGAPAVAQGVGEPSERLGPAEPPAEAEREISGVRAVLKEAESLLMRGEVETARTKLDGAEEQLTSIKEEYGPQLPPAYVPLFTAEEQIAGLRRQLDER
jgi:hypothetical protein